MLPRFVLLSWAKSLQVNSTKRCPCCSQSRILCVGGWSNCQLLVLSTCWDFASVVCKRRYGAQNWVRTFNLIVLELPLVFEGQKLSIFHGEWWISKDTIFVHSSNFYCDLIFLVHQCRRTTNCSFIIGRYFELEGIVRATIKSISISLKLYNENFIMIFYKKNFNSQFVSVQSKLVRYFLRDHLLSCKLRKSNCFSSLSSTKIHCCLFVVVFI